MLRLSCESLRDSFDMSQGGRRPRRDRLDRVSLCVAHETERGAVIDEGCFRTATWPIYGLEQNLWLFFQSGLGVRSHP